MRPVSPFPLFPILVVASCAGLASLWYLGRPAPRDGTRIAPAPGVSAISTGPLPANTVAGYDPTAAAELARLRAEIRRLREQLDAAQGSLAETTADLDHAIQELERLRRPLEIDMASATLRASLAPGEGVVTGGYRLPDGGRLFAFVETDEIPGGGIELTGRFFSIPDDLSRSLGLETLLTEAANTIQHGEVWIREELSAVVAKLEQDPAARILSAGIGTVTSGTPSEVPIIAKPGTPPLSLNVHAAYDENRNLDLELRVESLPPETPPETAPDAH